MSTGRRVIAIYGDCQAQVLHLLANETPCLADRFEFALVTNHYDPGETPPPVPPEIDRAVMLWEQYNEFADEATREALRNRVPAECAVVRFPAMLMNAFWPFRTKDKRNVSEPGYPWGRYPLGDRIAEEVAALEVPSSDAFALYMKRSMEQMPDLQAIVKFEQRVSLERDRSCDLAMSDYLFDNLQSIYQFWSHGNVSMTVYGELFQRLFDQGRETLGEAPVRLRAEVEALEAAHMPQFQIPIHPAVIDALGLRFVDANTKYRYFGHEWTFEEYMTRYIALDRTW